MLAAPITTHALPRRLTTTFVLRLRSRAGVRACSWGVGARPARIATNRGVGVIKKSSSLLGAWRGGRRQRRCVPAALLPAVHPGTRAVRRGQGCGVAASGALWRYWLPRSWRIARFRALTKAGDARVLVPLLLWQPQSLPSPPAPMPRTIARTLWPCTRPRARVARRTHSCSARHRVKASPNPRGRAPRRGRPLLGRWRPAKSW